MALRIATLALLTVLSAPAAKAAPREIHPGDFQSVVKNWAPGAAVRCAVLRSQADWDQVFRPFPVEGVTKPFGPQEGFWASSAVLLMAVVTEGGVDPDTAIHIDGLAPAAGGVDVAYSLSASHPASYKAKAWVGLVVAAPGPGAVRFRQAGDVTCTATGPG